MKIINIYQEDRKELHKLKIDLGHKKLADTVHYLILEIKGKIKNE